MGFSNILGFHTIFHFVQSKTPAGNLHLVHFVPFCQEEISVFRNVNSLPRLEMVYFLKLERLEMVYLFPSFYAKIRCLKAFLTSTSRSKPVNYQ